MIIFNLRVVFCLETEPPVKMFNEMILKHKYDMLLIYKYSDDVWYIWYFIYFFKSYYFIHN